MTRDDIIRMAREAGYNPEDGGVFKFDDFDLERFAALVAAAEREACAKVAEEERAGEPFGPITTLAKKYVAEAIRARGQQ